MRLDVFVSVRPVIANLQNAIQRWHSEPSETIKSHMMKILTIGEQKFTRLQKS